MFRKLGFEVIANTPAKPPAAIRSRAVEYAIDEKNLTIREVWPSEGSGSAMVAMDMGGLAWLPKTGNVLVCYGSALNAPLDRRTRGRNWREAAAGPPSASIRMGRRRSWFGKRWWKMCPPNRLAGRRTGPSTGRRYCLRENGAKRVQIL